MADGDGPFDTRVGTVFAVRVDLRLESPKIYTVTVDDGTVIGEIRPDGKRWRSRLQAGDCSGRESFGEETRKAAIAELVAEALDKGAITVANLGPVR